MTLLRFDGWITGLGTTSGTRIVVGCWPESPFGPVADVMLERPDGHRLLLAPTQALADFVAGTYHFDEVRVVPVVVAPAIARARGEVRLRAGDLAVTFRVGRRTAIGRLLRLVPRPLAGNRWWLAAIGWPARLLLPGVRTTGSAGGGRREWYAAHDHRLAQLLDAREGAAVLGGQADVRPPVRFGFGSVPATPSWTRVTTTVRVPGEG